MGRKRDCRRVYVGAGEPDVYSLTKNLVERLDWRGVNITPLPDRFRMLMKARPRDVNLNVAVGTEPGKVVFHGYCRSGNLEWACRPWSLRWWQCINA